MKTIWSILKETGQAWVDHDAPSRGAALAYYSVLSIAPLVVIAMAIAGVVFGNDAAAGQIVYQVRDTVGQAGAEVIQSILKNAHQPGSGMIAAGSGLVTLLFGASGVFGELRTSLNRIWDVHLNPEKAGVQGTVRLYILSFGLVLSIGFLLVLSLLVSTFFELVERWLSGRVPILPVWARVFNMLVAFVVIAFLFALIYKFVPSERIRWEDVWIGSFTAALLFTLGKYALALYISRMGVGSAFGAAGSVIVLLVWVYYSAQIFLFGAEFTHIYAQRRGRQQQAVNMAPAH